MTQKTDPQVGYGKPPIKSQFQKGQSGNPGGRPRGMTPGRAANLILEEAYREMTLREGGEVIKLPALQAVLRAQFSAALKGNATAQRSVIEMVRQIEGEFAALEAAEQAATPQFYSDLDLARWIASKLNAAAKRIQESKKE